MEVIAVLLEILERTYKNCDKPFLLFNWRFTSWFTVVTHDKVKDKINNEIF